MKEVRVQVRVASTIYSRELCFEEYPLPGDGITIWNEDRTLGIMVTVNKRYWQSDFRRLRLDCVKDGNGYFDVESLERCGFK